MSHLSGAREREAQQQFAARPSQPQGEGTTTHPSGTTGTTTTEGVQQQYNEKLKEAKETVQHAADQYLPPGTKETMRSAVRDTRSFYSRHPYVLPFLILLSMLTGFSFGTLTTGGLWAGSAVFGGYSRGSTEYEAHKKLDHILHSLQQGRGGAGGYMDKLGRLGMGGGEHGMMSNLFGGRNEPSHEGILDKIGLTSRGGGYTQPSGRGGWFGGSTESSRADEALSYMGDTFRDLKGRMTPKEETGFGSYLSEHLPVGLGGKPEQYQKPQRSFLDKVKGLYSKSEWEKVDEAEQKLREVLHAAAQRGEL